MTADRRWGSADGLPHRYYFEDFTPGQVHELGSVEVDEADMIAFARRFDPQPFHVDPDAAVASHFGGIIASGWYTCALFMRLYVEALLLDADSHGSPGMDEVRWLRPVRGGDVLTGRLEIVETRPSTRRPDRGTVFLLSELRNQHDEVVLRMTARGMFGRRSVG